MANMFRKGALIMEKLLSEPRTVVIPSLEEPFDPHQFYVNRNDLAVSNYFREKFLAAAQKVESLPAVEWFSFELLRQGSGDSIRGELPANHLFCDPSKFCAYLARMIRRQAKGREGDLLTNGHWNVFDFAAVSEVTGEVISALVDWNFGLRRWEVGAGVVGHDDYRDLDIWPRIFSLTR